MTSNDPITDGALAVCVVLAAATLAVVASALFAAAAARAFAPAPRAMDHQDDRRGGDDTIRSVDRLSRGRRR